VSDPALARLIDPLYRPNATVGSGSTAAAIRQELATGQPVGGAFHSQTAADSIRSLERWLSNNPAARPPARAHWHLHVIRAHAARMQYATR
jgi:hypothetical protein